MTRLDCEDESADAFARGVLLRWDSFAGGHDAFKLTEIDDNIGTFETAYGSCDDIADAALELLQNHGFFDRAEILVHRLFKDLGGDTAELASVQLHFHEFTDVSGGLDGAGFDERNFVRKRASTIAGLQFCEHLDFARLLVEVNADLSLQRVGLVSGGNQGILNDRGHHLAAYALLLFHVIEYCEEVLCIHVLIYFVVGGRLVAKKGWKPSSSHPTSAARRLLSNRIKTYESVNP